MGTPNPKKLKNTRISTKVGIAKNKKKRYNPYESHTHITEGLDETHLMEIPIFSAAEACKWAVVAGPKKPPSDK